MDAEKLLKKINKNTEKADKLVEQRNRNEGALATLMEELQKKYEVSTVEEAEELLIGLQADVEESKKELEKKNKELEDIIDNANQSV